MVPPHVLLLLLVAFASCIAALQLVQDAPSFGSAGQTNQKLIIALRERIASRADADEVQRHAKGEGRTKIMRNKDGRSYTCRIPNRAPAVLPAMPHAASAVAVPAVSTVEEHAMSAEGQPAQEPEPKSPLELLDQLNSLCLYRQEGMWTYEVCYKKHTRQFRQAMQRIVGGAQPEAIAAEDFTCGKFDAQQDLSIKYDFSSTGMPMTYISHNMTSGAPCVMTGAPRTSEVRFTCMPHAKDNLLVMVKEFPTCNYIYVVATPFLCAHPTFRPPPQRTHTIRCSTEEVEGPAGAGHGERGDGQGVPPPPAAAQQGQAEAEAAVTESAAEMVGQCKGGQDGDGGGSCEAAEGTGEVEVEDGVEGGGEAREGGEQEAGSEREDGVDDVYEDQVVDAVEDGEGGAYEEFQDAEE